MIEQMRAKYRRHRLLPLPTSIADDVAPVAVKTEMEVAGAYYLGHDEWKSLMHQPNDAREIHFDGNNYHFRGARLYPVAERQHFAVLYRPL